MRQKKSLPGIICSVVFLALFLMVFSIRGAIASECVRCHTQKEKLKAITDGLPEKIKSTENTGQG